MLFVDGIKFLEIGTAFYVLIRALENDSAFSKIDDLVSKL